MWELEDVIDVGGSQITQRKPLVSKLGTTIPYHIQLPITRIELGLLR